MKVEFLLKDSYLALIRNSVGSKSFAELFALVDGERKNIVDGGGTSCAFFVSSVLANFALVDSGHATVKATVKDMLSNDWKEISELRKGAVLLWEKRVQEGSEPHWHLGFYVGNDEAISNSWKQKSPQKHHYLFGEENRKIEKIFWHDSLEE